MMDEVQNLGSIVKRQTRPYHFERLDLLVIYLMNVVLLTRKSMLNISYSYFDASKRLYE